MEYKVRCSSISTLLAGCDKVNNKFEWKSLNKMTEAHIELAIEIFNKQEGLFIPADVCTLDMHAGKEQEPDAIDMYDRFFGTCYFNDYVLNREALDKHEKENEWITGTRDFGNDIETIDCKISTDKNIFDKKRFKPIENDYVIQLNGYRLLYGTDVLKLYNALMPATLGQIKKMVWSKDYIEMLSDTERDEYQYQIENNYDYSLLPESKRIHVRDVPIIENFDVIVKHRVEVLNEWIKNNLK